MTRSAHAADNETTLTLKWLNAEVCRHKECDRIAEMRKALTVMGADVAERDDGLVIRGGAIHGARLDSRADHRLVMTLAVAGLVAEGTTVISKTECVKKTFPAFVSEMQAIGCDMRKRS